MTGRIAIAALGLLTLAACASPSAPPPAPLAPLPSQEPAWSEFEPLTTLRMCPGPNRAAHPASAPDGTILDYRPIVHVNGVPLLKAPTRDVCLYRAVGFGPRMHEGLDLAPLPRDRHGTIVAAGDGVVVETGNGHGYGVWVLIDHGRGVYTRYAHLASVDPVIATGAYVTQGTPLGVMGGTGGVPVHLHYAILTGRFDGPARSFGLSPVDPFGLPLDELSS